MGFGGTDPPTGQKGVGKRGKAVLVLEICGKLRKNQRIFLVERWEKVHYFFCVFFNGEFGRVLVDFLILVGFYDPQRSWNPLRVIEK